MLQVVLLQNQTAFETYDVYYKMRRYNETCSPKYQNILNLSKCTVCIAACKLGNCQVFYLYTKVNLIAKI